MPKATQVAVTVQSSPVQNLYTTQLLKIAEIKPSPFGIRQRRSGILEESVKAEGILSHILVRTKKSGKCKYEVIFGDGRLLMAVKLKQKMIWADIKDCSDDNKALRWHVDENVARDGFNFTEKSKAYFLLNTQCNMSYRDIAERYMESLGTVENAVGFWKMTEKDPKVRKIVEEGKIPSSYIPDVMQLAEDDTKLAHDAIVAASKGTLDLVDVKKVSEHIPKSDMRKHLRKAIDKEIDLKDLRQDGTRSTLASSAKILVRDSFDKHEGPSDSAKLLSTGHSLLDVGNLSADDIKQMTKDPTSELVLDSVGEEGSGSPRKFGVEKWYPVSDIMRPIMKIIQTDILETAEVSFEKECECSNPKCKMKTKYRFRVNLSNQGIQVNLTKAKYALAESDLEKAKAHFSEGLAELNGYKVQEKHEELIAKAIVQENS